MTLPSGGSGRRDSVMAHRVPTVDELRTALAALGFSPCGEHAPEGPDEEVSGLLAVLLAVTQRHIQDRERHAETISRLYHNTRHLLDFPSCTCGSPHDRQEDYR